MIVGERQLVGRALGSSLHLRGVLPCQCDASTIICIDMEVRAMHWATVTKSRTWVATVARAALSLTVITAVPLTVGWVPAAHADSVEYWTSLV